MNLPPWIRTSTRPTPAEVERLVSSIDPAVVAFARDATAPSPAEIAALRRGRHRRDLRPSLTALAFVTIGAAAVATMWVGPEMRVMTEAPLEPGVYLVTTEDDLTPITGVWVRGEGSVEVAGDGRLVLTGDLLLTVTAPVVFEVDHHTFSAADAVVWVDGTGLRIADGEVRDADAALVAGQRWSVPEPAVADRVADRVPVELPPVATVPDLVVSMAVRPQPAPEVVPPPVVVPEVGPEVAPQPDGVAPVPAPSGTAEPEVAPVPSAAIAWRDVLVRLEQGGTADDRIAALRSYRKRYPDSPFVVEADALMLLIRGADGDPRERLDAVERWLGRNPDGARAVELHALAARIAREGLHDCARAEPHDWVVKARASGTSGAKAQAFLGLCAISSGRLADGHELLADLDPDLLEPALRQAVAAARKGGSP